MTFQTYTYDVLKEKINELDSLYSNYLGRYAVSISKEHQKKLEEAEEAKKPLIKKQLAFQSLCDYIDEYVIKSPSNRAPQIQVFLQLTTELKSFVNGTEDQVTKATLCVLGALIHRRLRLIQEYELRNKAANAINPLSFFSKPVQVCSLANCRLYTGIELALGLNPRKALDEWTIAYALSLFRDYMYLEATVESKEKKPITILRYKTYPHFDEGDPNFKKHLDKIIAEAKEKAASRIKQYHAIDLLKSFVASCDKGVTEVSKDIKAWCSFMSGKQKDFAKLTSESIKNYYLVHFKEPKTYQSKKVWVLHCMLQKKGFAEIKNYQEFEAKLIEYLKDECRHIFCGVYVLLSSQHPKFGLDSRFKTFLQQTFGLEKEGLEIKLSLKDRYESIGVLNKYMRDANPYRALDCNFFEGEESEVASAVLQLSVSLGEQLREASKAKAPQKEEEVDDDEVKGLFASMLTS